MSYRVLDMTAGFRSMWLDRVDPSSVFVDLRREVKPTIIANSRFLPLRAEVFSLVVFDPPYKYFTTVQRLSRIYGSFRMAEVVELLRAGPEEAARVLQPGGIMLFKWGGSGRRTASCLRLFSKRLKPIIAHHYASRTSTGPGVDYVILLKIN